MQFSYSQDRIVSATDNIPRPEDLNSDLSEQDEHDIVEILDTVGSCLRRNGNRHQGAYKILWTRPLRWRGRNFERRENFEPERVLAEVARLIADECGWDVVFDLEDSVYVQIRLSTPASQDIDQLDLF